MTHGPEEVLAALALGETDVSAADREHVRSCPTCAADVADLRRVSLLLTETREEEEGELAPDEGVWERIAAATATGPAAAAGPLVVAPMPREPTAPAQPWPTARRSRRWPLLAAAALLLVAGIGLGRLVWGPSGLPVPQVVSSVQLSTLDGSQSLGRADLLDQGGETELRISTGTMPSAPGYVGVWLLNDDGERMLSLGVLDTQKALFAVPPAALAQGYRIVDLSRERYDNDARHSGDSIMRGTLPA